MLNFIEKFKNDTYKWFNERADGPHMRAWLCFVAFIESIVLPIPTAAFLLGVYMAGASRHFFLAALTTLFSVLGGIAGYFVGLFFFDVIGAYIVELYHLQEEFAFVQSEYDKNTFIVTFLAAFTPIPYKIFALSAGFLKANLAQFIIASVIGRGLQFFLIAYVMKLFGDKATKLVLKYFNYFAILGVLILIYLFFFR